MSERSNFYGAVLKVIACTPNLNPDQKEYDRGVLEPSRRIREYLDRSGDLSVDEAREVVGLLKRVLDTKRVDAAERRDRLADVFGRLSPPIAATMREES